MKSGWESFWESMQNSTEETVSNTELESDYDRAFFLQTVLISRATGGSQVSDDSDYKSLRKYFLSGDNKNILPDWIKAIHDLSQFWSFIKHKFPTYADRREFIWNEFSPLLSILESAKNSFVEGNIGEGLFTFNEEHIHKEWEKALDRKNQDPEGAITTARSLLESVCKHILDFKKIEYDYQKIELHELYKKTSVVLNLNSKQHEHESLKMILGGCSSVVNGLGNLRNKLGDAHGKSTKISMKPSMRHSELAVNLAGSMALFLVRTFDDRKTCDSFCESK